MGSNEIQNILTCLANGQHLTGTQASQAFQIIMNGGATPAQMGAFLLGLRAKGETVVEITEGARVLRSRAAHIQAPEHAIDTCGTGGDMRCTLNISTAVAIVVAACGVPVAKHGNRAISSASGSADVLQELGLDVTTSPEQASTCLANVGMCFLMAPSYHKAMRHVAPVRNELGLRTVFNLLGPLANPAGVKQQLLGVYDAKWLVPMAQVLRELGSTRALIVHGDDGLDEITTTTTTHVAELHADGSISEYSIDPQVLGLPLASMQELAGLDASYNAKRLRALLAGTRDAYRDIVLLNAAAALKIAGKVENLEDGLLLAAQAVDSYKAAQLLDALVGADGGSAMPMSAE